MEIQELCEYDLKNKNCSMIKEDKFTSKLDKLVEDIAKKEGYICYNVEDKEISTDGGNYLGVLREVDVTGQTKDGDKETSIFVKQIIALDNHKILSVATAYFKESFFYQELAKIFEDLQIEANVPIKERYNMPKSYHVDKEFIMLENLSKKGYKTLHRMDVLPLRFAELCIQQLAKLHGLSLILQKRKPDYFDKKIKTLKQPFHVNEDTRAFFKKQCGVCTQNLSIEYKKKIDEFVPLFWEKFKEYHADTTLPGCAIVHSDYRTNNILVKEIDGQFTKVVPVDYQLIFYGCPIYDFLYFIFTGSDRKFRKDHLTDLKNLYYRSMEQFLKYFDLNLEDIFPREEFERRFKERLYWGLMVALFCTPFLFAAEGNAPDLDKEELTSVEFVLDSKFDERIQGVLDDYIEWGLL